MRAAVTLTFTDWDLSGPSDVWERLDSLTREYNTETRVNNIASADMGNTYTTFAPVDVRCNTSHVEPESMCYFPSSLVDFESDPQEFTELMDRQMTNPGFYDDFPEMEEEERTREALSNINPPQGLIAPSAE